MKKIKLLFESLPEPTVLFDELSKIKLDDINKYWLSNGLQLPKNNDEDRKIADIYRPWSLQAAYMSTSFFYSKYLKDYKNGLDYALKALEVLNNTQGIPDYSIAATYNRVFKAYIELEEYNAAIELALKHFEAIKNTENVSDTKLGFAYNLIAISYKWSAEKIKDKKLANSYYVAAIKHFNLAITSWSENTNDQNLKRARASINVGLCEHEVLLIGLETKSINTKKIIEMIEKGLKEIKDPKLESFLTKPTKALIEKAEVTLLNLSK